MKRMESETNRKATFFTTLAFLKDAKAEPEIFVGKCEGILSTKVEDNYLPGIPLSAVFKPNGINQVYSSLTTNEKNSISHRGRAASQLREFFEK